MHVCTIKCHLWLIMYDGQNITARNQHIRDPHHMTGTMKMMMLHVARSLTQTLLYLVLSLIGWRTSLKGACSSHFFIAFIAGAGATAFAFIAFFMAFIQRRFRLRNFR